MDVRKISRLTVHRQSPTSEKLSGQWPQWAGRACSVPELSDRFSIAASVKLVLMTACCHPFALWRM